MCKDPVNPLKVNTHKLQHGKTKTLLVEICHLKILKKNQNASKMLSSLMVHLC